MARHDPEHLRDQRQGGGVAVDWDRPGVLVFHLGAALLQLEDAHADPLQNIERLEAGHHHGNFVFPGERLVGARPGHGANMPCGQEALNPVPL